MAIYTVELLLRVAAYGCAKCCRDGWFLFDAILAPWQQGERHVLSPQEVGHQEVSHVKNAGTLAGKILDTFI